VLTERNFRRFYTGYVTSLLGTSMSTVAIAWAVLDSGGSPTALGLVFAASVVPQVLLLAFAGAVADRLGRRRMMLAADVLRCGAQACLAAALFAGRPAIWLFVLLAWLGGSGQAFFSPALSALTVEIAPSDQLGNANALYGLATSVTRIVGPALSGVLVAFAGPAVVVAADAASYLASVLALSLLQLPRTGKAAPGGRGRRTLFSDMAEGWSAFRSRNWLWVVTVQFAFFNLITWAPWMLLGPVEGRSYLGGAAVWGAIMAVQGTGAIVACLLSLGRRPRRPMVIATIGTFCYALPDIPMALHATAPWIGAAAFACGAGAPLSSTFFSTTLQQQVPPDSTPLAPHKTRRQGFLAAPRSAAKAASRATTVMTTATGSTCATSVAGVKATMPNATATPLTAMASAAATRGVRSVVRTISRASRGSRSTIQAKHPAVAAASAPRPMTKGSRSRCVTAGTQIRTRAISVNK
jgi:MFS family permease